ncbi:hypothetical protein CTT31_19845 [Pseudoalteromonas maricaloris]|uniref:hypothetical protein n=2 Tax=Pseudoalteromonas TaxID=53246 RepID=UPI0021AD5E58|nr:hypothetical protein [Pseudoalteromonas flavipulchra]USE71341.1 hypothetical protein CTT31_19845 [Pseudoalteromonas flavipulchra]
MMLKTGTYILFYVLFADYVGGVFLVGRNNSTILMDSTAMGFTVVQVVIFLAAIFTLYKVQDIEAGYCKQINYSDKFKARLLIKYVGIWLAVALFIDLLFAILFGSEFWADINPFDSWLVFCFVYIVYKFSSSLQVSFNYQDESMKCHRLGLLTSSIMKFKKVDLTDNQLVITSGDEGKYFFHLDRFTLTNRERLVSNCLKMSNKAPN